MAMLRAAVVNEEASAQLREFIQARLIDGMASRPVITDDAALRAGLASSMLVGLDHRTPHRRSSHRRGR